MEIQAAVSRESSTGLSQTIHTASLQKKEDARRVMRDIGMIIMWAYVRELVHPMSWRGRR
jgi:hypothetical protein